MDRIHKFIRKLSKDQRAQITLVLKRIQSGNLAGLDVKKLQGREGEFRVRKGEIRIICVHRGGGFEVIDIQWRGSKTYR